MAGVALLRTLNFEYFFVSFFEIKLRIVQVLQNVTMLKNIKIGLQPK